MRWGVIGTGTVAGLIATDMRATAPNEPVAICSCDRDRDRDRDRAAAFARKHALPIAYAHVAAMRVDDAVDAVCTATLHATHHRLAAALEVGRRVLLEKPMTLEVRALVAH